MNLYGYNRRGTWFQQYFLPPTPIHYPSICVKDDIVYMLGGELPSGQPNHNIYSYDLRSKEWRTHNNKFSFHLTRAIAIATDNREVLVFGGVNVGGLFSRMLIRVPVKREATV
jgi:N-acetylneuraminic acid mutarotase